MAQSMSNRLSFYGLLGVLTLLVLNACGPKPKKVESWGFNQEKSTHTQWLPSDYIPPGGRKNPLNLDQESFLKYKARGQIHAQRYPVSVTGVLLPERPIKEVLNNKTWNPIKAILNEVFKAFAGTESFEDMLSWVGLLEYPQNLEELSFAVPESLSEDELLGYSRIDVGGTKAFTMSCATCHSAQLFGKTFLGMTKRFPRANDFFIKGHKASKYYNSFIFKTYTGATDAEMDLLERSMESLNAVGFKKPQTLGLDTSLAQVALSLKKREDNTWADKSSYYEKYPRPDYLDKNPGDSKPAVWWNLKYKTRWLSDGSVISGNPIYTNLLWNEIGRGTDLRDLAQWLQANKKTIDELTSAVFSTKAPRIEEFFPAEKIPKNSALRGEKVFEQTCASCHGHYDKNWSLKAYQNRPWSEQIKTYQVRYPQPTLVKDVGTDPYRYLSMKSLEALNDLEISKQQNILIQAQKGYVPPPLVGIWARWPYLHNNAVPSLCALLEPSEKRPKTYYAVAPVDKKKDFDFDCNGYPESLPREWTERDKIYRTSKKGLSNSGHDEGIFIKNGQEILSTQDKKDLIHFLQTL